MKTSSAKNAASNAPLEKVKVEVYSVLPFLGITGIRLALNWVADKFEQNIYSIPDLKDV
jgi:hypothetical protein